MTPFTLPIPTYQCHKRVQALKIKAVVPNPRGYELHFEDERFVPMQVDFEWVDRHEPLSGGYVVWYPGDNYVSFSPAAAFEAGYTLVETADGAVRSPDWSAWPGGPSEVEAALASRDEEIERLTASLDKNAMPDDYILIADHLASARLENKRLRDAINLMLRDKWHWEEIAVNAVGPATQAAREAVAEPQDISDLIDMHPIGRPMKSLHGR